MASIMFQTKYIKQPNNYYVVLRIIGAIDGTTASILDEKLQKILTQYYGLPIILNLEDLNYANSCAMVRFVGLSAIYQLLTRYELYFLKIPEKIIALFDMLGILDLIHVLENQEDVLEISKIIEIDNKNESDRVGEEFELVKVHESGPEKKHVVVVVKGNITEENIEGINYAFSSLRLPVKGYVLYDFSQVRFFEPKTCEKLLDCLSRDGLIVNAINVPDTWQPIYFFMGRNYLFFKNQLPVENIISPEQVAAVIELFKIQRLLAQIQESYNRAKDVLQSQKEYYSDCLKTYAQAQKQYKESSEKPKK